MILRRDFGVDISESSTGRIMTKLRFTSSRHALRRKRKRRFKEHYGEIDKDAQIDHMMVTKNELSALASAFTQTFTSRQIVLMPLNFYEN